MNTSTMAPQDILEVALAKSGLSLRKFAEDEMGRDERSVRRWRAGTSPIPPAAVRWLERYISPPRKKRAPRKAVAAAS